MSLIPGMEPDAPRPRTWADVAMMALFVIMVLGCGALCVFFFWGPRR